MRRLGKGLRDLLGGAEGVAIVELDVGAIVPNPYQPRSDVEEHLEELVESIKRDGLLQPIVVRPYGEGYQIVFGERRWRAAMKAGFAKVPAVVKDVEDEDLFRYALVENMQRRDLNPIAKARAIKAYMERYGYTQAEVASRLGVSRSYIANTLRLLALPSDVKARLEKGEISPSAVRHIISAGGARSQKPVRSRDDAIRAMETELKGLSRWDVKISGDVDGGRVVIRYRSRDDLMELFDVLKRAFGRVRS